MTRQDSPSRSQFFNPLTRWVIGVALVIALVEATGVGNVRAQSVFQSVATAVLYGVTALVAWRIIGLGKHSAIRRFWGAILVGYIVRGLADLGQGGSVALGYLADPVTQSSAAKIVYGLTLLILVRDFVFWPLAATSARERTRLVMDLCTVMVSVAGLGWFFILAPSLDSPTSTSKIVMASLQFSLVLVYANFFRLLLSNASPLTRRSNYIAVFAAGFFGAAEMLAPMLSGSPHAHWVFVLRILGMVMQFLTCNSQAYDMLHASDATEAKQSKPYRITPYVVMAFLYGVLVVELLKAESLSMAIGGLFACATLTTVVVVVRQLSAFVDNAGLLAQLDQNFRDLEASYQREQDANRARAELEVELRQTQKLEALGRLAGGVAHEINTPVQYLQGNVAFLGDCFTQLTEVAENCRNGIHVDDGTDLEFLEEVPGALLDTTEGLSRVVTIVKSLQAIGIEHAAANQSICRISDSVRDALVVNGSELARAATIEVELDDAVLVRGNSRDLGQVWFALLENAAQAVEATGDPGTISVRAFVEGNEVVVEISDDGEGMAPDVLERAFDPFFTTRPVGSGTGQGLSIARSIVIDGHGGRIDASSELGVGSAFRVVLPLVANGRSERPNVDAPASVEAIV